MSHIPTFRYSRKKQTQMVPLHSVQCGWITNTTLLEAYLGTRRVILPPPPSPLSFIVSSSHQGFSAFTATSVRAPEIWSMCFPLHSSSPPSSQACHSLPQLCPLSDLAFLQTYSRLFILLDTEEAWMDSSLAQDLLLSSDQAPVRRGSRAGPPYNSKLSILFTAGTCLRG